MQTPWFIELLALQADADERAVKRAYAARLKQVDPGADPAGFARLREAYEFARAWVGQQQPGDTAPPEVQASMPAAAPVQRVVNEDPHAAATRLAERFIRRVRYGEQADFASELEACAAELRRQHIDAPFLFERILLDAMMHARMRRRAYVFDTLRAHFGWHEVMHLASLGPAGAWIDAVEQQRQAFETLPPLAQKDLRSWLARHGESSTPIPDDVALAWPHVSEALARFPRYLGLYLTEARVTEWQRRCAEAQSAAAAHVEAEARRMKAYKASRQRRSVSVNWFSRFGLGFLVLWVFHALVSLPGVTAPAPSAAAPVAAVPATTPRSHVAPHVPGRNEAERSRAFFCMATIDQIDAPGTQATPQQAADARDCHVFLDALAREGVH
ncbi:hypothetical protein FIV34_02655 [Luteibacter pinisoli]|uniref:J domain-containing protein n=1 Tax=Luteibacter pinisoli TaxID=2589080 RepID=A0A4Y5Z0M0_9GAMM|nr:hypothetical protein [Luteibacter pinisoli]QDE38179.1 hypothetical protein FIV34_02655 [Luteibacter pinisoli]